MKDFEILKKVRYNIENSIGSAHICFQLDQIEANDKEMRTQIRSLKRWISSMLGGDTFTYGEWLASRSPYVKQLLPQTVNGDVKEEYYIICRQGRLAWLDWMIAYCEREENEVQKPNIN